jgi:UDPglucose 6-dehydrogenase
VSGSPTGAGAAIGVVGAGYVGLPTAGVLAKLGHHVVCAERDPLRFEALASGRVPIVEDGLAELLSEGVASGRLRFVRRAADAARGAAYVFLCVATPEGERGSADLSFVDAVAREITETLEPGAIVVTKSTVPVGTALALARATGAPVVSNPEFLREGTAVRDSLRPDRVVVGGDDRTAARRVGELFSKTGAPLIVTDTLTAETIKYASNAFLATKLSFVNALAGLCETVGADVRDVILGLGYDRRIGFDFLAPGPGWGGSCLPKDTAALVHIAEEAGYDFPMLREAIAANDAARARVVDKVRSAAGGELDGVTVGVWGLTFKAGTNDRRMSPAVMIARQLLALGAHVRAYDPTVAARAPDGDLRGMVVCADAYDASRDAHAVALLTEWEELRDLDFSKVADLMAQPSIVDARNLLDPDALRRCGFTYTGVGRR